MPDSTLPPPEHSPEYQELLRKYEALLQSENESQEHLRLLVESAVDYTIITLTPEGIINSWNSGAQRMFGWTEDEIIGQPSDVLFTPEDRATGQPQKEMQTALSEGRAADERYHLRKDGSRFYVSGVMTPLLNDHLHGFAKIARDLTQSKQAESDLQKAHEQSVEILESINDAFYAVDRDFNFTYINKKAEEWWKCSRDELIGKHYWTEFPQVVGTHTYDMHLLAMTERRPLHYETSSPLIGQWVEVSIYPDERGGLSVYFFNIHDRKQAQDALRESEESLRLAVEAGTIGTCDWTYPTGEMRWNDVRFRLYGLEPSDELKHIEDVFAVIHPDDRDRARRQMKMGIEERGEHSEDYRVVWPDGSVHWMRETGRVVERQDGHPQRVISVLFDITAQREAQHVLLRSHEQLEARVTERTHELAEALERVRAEMEQRVAAQASRADLMRRIVNTQEEERGRISRELHDNLGQHLTAVMLGLQSLEMQIGDITGGKRQTEVPQLGALRELVDGLMKAAHRQAWELRPAELDAMGLGAALDQYIRDWTQQSGVPVDFQSVGWDKRRPNSTLETTFYRVVQEALTNVARHAKATQVSVILERRTTSASVIIEDNGKGFDPETSTSRLGLLGMSERLALIGGTLDIESSEEGGTTIYARAPL